MSLNPFSLMYHDGFDHFLDRCQPGNDELLPARSPWGHRALGLSLLALLALMHSCG